ncbi:MAG: flavodoxin family protein [Lachnospiraceae bacterium]|nr:flavodoxin family protein [Lachnospiraceae bacterium]
MKLLIHDLSEAEWGKVAAEYEGWDVVAPNGDIKPCAGCFGCWMKETGVCVIKDGFERMGERIHRAEEVVIISHYTYGGFSSFVKNVMDRSIGYILPFFRIYKGETHHKPRYREKKPFRFIFLGKGLNDAEKEKASRYVKAVCRNFNATVKEVRFEEAGEQEVEETTASTQQPIVEGKTILLNCSPHGEEGNSKKFLDVLANGMEGDMESINLYTYGKRLSELVPMVQSAEKLVLGIPLYVDGIPSVLLRLMELLEKTRLHSNQKIYVVSNMGFYESKQLVNLLSMVKEWCEKSGGQYYGAIAIGAGGMIAPLLHYGSNGPGKNVYDGLTEMAGVVQTGGEFAEIYTKTHKFPRIAFLFAANRIMKQGIERAKQ